MKNLISINDLTSADIKNILKNADKYFQKNKEKNKKVDLFGGRTVINMFFENSTRTRTSFEVAEKRLGFDVVNFDSSISSMNKNESVKDTCLTLNAMNPDIIVTRHKDEGFARSIAEYFNCPIINAGDGKNEHPTQALLDAHTILRFKGKIQGLTIAICGDINHSRVAKSNLKLLNKLGANVRFVGPKYFVNRDNFLDEKVEIFHNLKDGIKDADIVMMLRIQFERLDAEENIQTAEDYHKEWGLNHEKLKFADPDVLVMHPAPINRGIEITSELADDKSKSIIFDQIESGVATRQAILEWILEDAK
jgi:aspartate carbamoyltransferase catalytic subunit